jgi:hypothetical protein
MLTLRCLFTLRSIFYRFPRQPEPLPAPRSGKVDALKYKHQFRKFHTAVILKRSRTEPALLKTLVPDAVTGTVPHQYLNHGGPPVEKYKQMSAQRIGMKQFLDAAAQPVKGLSHVDRRRTGVHLNRRRKTQHRYRPPEYRWSADTMHSRCSVLGMTCSSRRVPSEKLIVIRGDPPCNVPTGIKEECVTGR